MLERVGLAGWSLRNWLEFKSLKGRLAHEMTIDHGGGGGHVVDGKAGRVADEDGFGMRSKKISDDATLCERVLPSNGGKGVESRLIGEEKDLKLIYFR